MSGLDLRQAQPVAPLKKGADVRPLFESQDPQPKGNREPAGVDFVAIKQTNCPRKVLAPSGSPGYHDLTQQGGRLMFKEIGTRKLSIFVAVLTCALAGLIIVQELDLIWPLG
jgi:hypothetical protein